MIPEETRGSGKQKLINLTVAGIVSQVGCITLLIIIGALFLGLYLDGKFDTRPWFTIGIILASIPVSLAVMFFIVRITLKKLKPINPTQKTQEEKNLGE